MNINWKLRFQNKAVLTGLVGAVLLFVKQVTELLGFDLSAQLEQISGIIGAVLTLLAGIGVITDPTSKGYPTAVLCRRINNHVTAKVQMSKLRGKQILVL